VRDFCALHRCAVATASGNYLRVNITGRTCGRAAFVVTHRHAHNMALPYSPKIPNLPYQSTLLKIRTSNTEVRADLSRSAIISALE
jgi:hypothetical protein